MPAPALTLHTNASSNTDTSRPHRPISSLLSHLTLFTKPDYVFLCPFGPWCHLTCPSLAAAAAAPYRNSRRRKADAAAVHCLRRRDSGPHGRLERPLGGMASRRRLLPLGRAMARRRRPNQYACARRLPRHRRLPGRPGAQGSSGNAGPRRGVGAGRARLPGGTDVLCRGAAAGHGAAEPPAIGRCCARHW